MQKAIFLYNDGTILPECFSNKIPQNNKNDYNLLFQLKQLQLYGYKIIQFLPLSQQNNKERLKNIRILNIDEQCSHKMPLIIKEFYYEEDHNIESTIELLNLAASFLTIELSKSWIIGNTLNDVEAGNVLGMYSIIIDNGAEYEWFFGPGRTPNHFVRDFNSAIDNIKLQSIAVF